VNFWVVPLAMLGLVGKIAIDISVALVIVIEEVPDMLPNDATMVAEPTLSPVTSPALLTSVVFASDELQITDEVRSAVVLSE
jgi:hypothetical protein